MRGVRTSPSAAKLARDRRHRTTGYCGQARGARGWPERTAAVAARMHRHFQIADPILHVALDTMRRG